jgi:hypothetical protein
MPDVILQFKPLPLAQGYPYEDRPPADDKPPARPMTFSDLQQGLRDVHSGKVDNSAFRNGVLILLTCLALFALFVHFRRRRIEPAPPDSLARLGRELGRKVRFPLGSKFLLKWVARATRTPYPALLISSALFDKSVARWLNEPAFGAARQWGYNRLMRLRPVLFG